MQGKQPVGWGGKQDGIQGKRLVGQGGRIMTPIIVDKELKRQHIMGSALNVILRKGYRETKIKDIAEEAGIGKGTFYEYFDSKEDLGVHLYEWINIIAETQMINELSMIDEPLERFRLYVLYILDTHIRFSSFHDFVFGLWADVTRKRMEESESDEMDKALYESMSSLRAVLKYGMEKGVLRVVDIDEAAILLFSAIDGICAHMEIGLRGYTTEEVSWKIMDLLMVGMATEEGKKRWEDESADRLE
jgi:TetR/AcrR family fatty acid metabolism transcriptional regulator